MRDPKFSIAGDVEIPAGVTKVRLVTPISQYDFVTIELGDDDDTLYVRKVEPDELQDFDGVLFQADSTDEEDGVVLRQMSVAFWPFEDEDDEGDNDDDEGDDDGEDETEDDVEEEAIAEEGSAPRPFKVVEIDWWKDFSKTHKRG